MADVIPAKLWMVQMQVDAGLRVVYPLLFPDVTWLNGTKLGLARKFSRNYQKYVMEEGHYLQSMLLVPDIAVEKDRFSMRLPAASDGFLYPELSVEVEYCWFSLEGEEQEVGVEAQSNAAKGKPAQRLLGLVPSCGVEACATTQDELRERLESSVMLALARRKRLKSVRALLPLLWMEDIAISSEDLDIEYYSLAELRELQSQRKQRMLPEVALKLLVSTKATFGRAEEIEQLARVGRSRYFRSVLLVGPSGTGKTALIQEWERIKHDHGQANTAIWEVSAARLLQKLTNHSGWQHNLALLCEELHEAGDVLYVSKFAQLFEVGRYVGNEVSMGEFLRDYVARGQLVLFSECTEEELAQIELRYPGVLPAYQIIRLQEQEGEDLKQVIHAKASQMAHAQGVRLERDAVEEAILLHRRFTPYSGFPGKPLRFLEALIYHAKASSRAIDRAACIHHFCEQTGMPAFLVSPDIPMPLKACGEYFQKQIFGQTKAVQVVVDLLASVKAGLSRQGKPIASLLFVGPTGVGKTEMAKVLAEYLFSDRERMVRFDMSEFSDLPNVLRLTGESMSRDGLLTSVIREQPFCVLLFDELEKAHPSFYDLLLQILGSGRLTDGRGRTADFCSTVIIMTSNIGTDTMQQGRVGFVETANQAEELEVHFERAVQRIFRPELFNRIDHIVPFASLGRSTVEHILQRELAKIRAREGLRFREVEFVIDDSLQIFLTEEGYHPLYGARHLQRTLRDNVLSPMARELNQHGPSKPLLTKAHRTPEHTVVTVEERKDNSWKEKVITGTSLTLVTLTDLLTWRRREIQAVEDGPILIHLLSEIEILERSKKRNEKKFWSDRAQGELYSTYLELSATFSRLLHEALELEAEAITALLVGQPLEAEIVSSAEVWNTQYLSMKTRLYNTMNPDEQYCLLAVYGEHTRLLNVVEPYFKMVEERSFSLTIYAIWLEEGLKPWREPMPLQTRKDRVLGMVLSLEGRAAHLFWEEESGLQIWDDGAEFKYVVEVLPHRIAQYKVPDSIHRQKFFDNRKTRRLFANRRFYDSTYDIDGSIHEAKDRFLRYLDQRFERIVTNRLIGHEDNYVSPHIK